MTTAQAVRFDEDDMNDYAHGTLIECDTGRGTSERCPNALAWGETGYVCYECTGAFCDVCCYEGEYDLDDDFFCEQCIESMDQEPA